MQLQARHNLQIQSYKSDLYFEDRALFWLCLFKKNIVELEKIAMMAISVTKDKVWPPQKMELNREGILG